MMGFYLFILLFALSCLRFILACFMPYKSPLLTAGREGRRTSYSGRPVSPPGACDLIMVCGGPGVAILVLYAANVRSFVVVVCCVIDYDGFIVVSFFFVSL